MHSIMPLAWVDELSRQQAEELACQLGLSTDRMLDELRKRIKEKWTAVEPFLPSHSAAKSIGPRQPDPVREEALVMTVYILPR
jgi:hypothetical protein